MDLKLRSPWYDNECDRASHPQQIAQELDMDPFASDFQYFDGNQIQEIEKTDVRKPYRQGRIVYDSKSLEPLGFDDDEKGPLKLWINPDVYGKLPEGNSYAAGVDISAGTGASNSTISIVNIKTGEKVAEYADPSVMPESFAPVAIAICKWFSEAYMIPDGAGCGRQFCDTVISLGYLNIYFRRNEEGIAKNISDKPGVFLNPKEKTVTISRYRQALKDKEFIQRSHEANQECLSYIYTINNSIEHSSAKNSDDPSGAGANHGDRVIADALACKGLILLRETKGAETEKAIPTNCYKSRRLDRERKKLQKSSW
jgi:hypothetical protein